MANPIYKTKVDILEANGVISNGNITVGEQEFNEITWSQDLITNKVNLSGKTIRFDTSVDVSTFPDMGFRVVLIGSTKKYALDLAQYGGSLQSLSSSGAPTGTNATMIYDAVVGWFIDSITLPSDFGYIIEPGSSDYGYTSGGVLSESRIQNLNLILQVQDIFHKI